MSLSGPLGVITGYGMTALILSFENLSYRHSFGLQGILQFISVIIVLSINSQYIEIDVAVNAVKKEKKKRQRDEKIRLGQTIGGTGEPMNFKNTNDESINQNTLVDSSGAPIRRG